LILLAGELHQILVDDVADMLEVGGEGDDVGGTPSFRLIEAGARYPR